MSPTGISSGTARRTMSSELLAKPEANTNKFMKINNLMVYQQQKHTFDIVLQEAQGSRHFPSGCMLSSSGMR
jgi:hypothetical protein